MMGMDRQLSNSSSASLPLKLIIISKLTFTPGPNEREIETAATGVGDDERAVPSLRRATVTTETAH